MEKKIKRQKKTHNIEMTLWSKHKTSGYDLYNA